MCSKGTVRYSFAGRCGVAQEVGEEYSKLSPSKEDSFSFSLSLSLSLSLSVSLLFAASLRLG